MADLENKLLKILCDYASFEITHAQTIEKIKQLINDAYGAGYAEGIHKGMARPALYTGR